MSRVTRHFSSPPPLCPLAHSAHGLLDLQDILDGPLDGGMGGGEGGDHEAALDSLDKRRLHEILGTGEI